MSTTALRLQSVSKPGTATASRPATGSRPPTRTAANQRSSITSMWPPLSSRGPPLSPAPFSGADDNKLESLLWLALGTLTNLAGAADVAPKMLARGIVPILAQLLPWPSAHLELLAITLLLQLSVLDQASCFPFLPPSPTLCLFTRMFCAVQSRASKVHSHSLGIDHCECNPSRYQLFGFSGWILHASSGLTCLTSSADAGVQQDPGSFTFLCTLVL